MLEVHFACYSEQDAQKAKEALTYHIATYEGGYFIVNTEGVYVQCYIKDAGAGIHAMIMAKTLNTIMTNVIGAYTLTRFQFIDPSFK